MKLISFEQLRDEELRVSSKPLSRRHGRKPVDKYMEESYGELGEDSEEFEMREFRSRKMLSERSFPAYNPFG